MATSSSALKGRGSDRSDCTTGQLASYKLFTAAQIVLPKKVSYLLGPTAQTQEAGSLRSGRQPCFVEYLESKATRARLAPCRRPQT
jgi:hypothetical protein